MTPTELLALNVKVLRKKTGFTQEKLAEAAGLSVQTISDIEGGRTWVSSSVLSKLSGILNVDVFQLFLPPAEVEGEDLDSLLYNRLLKLKAAMKADIDKRFDQFYLTEKLTEKSSSQV